MSYQFNIENCRVIDGDTIDADIDLGFDVWLRKQRIRLFGIDAPEIRTKDAYEKRRGLDAKIWLVDKLKDVEDIALISEEYERGKYGRIIGTIMVGTIDINQLMLSLDLVKAYEAT